MTYTSHGHHIPDSIDVESPPEKKARCGGPGLCSVCSFEALQFSKNHVTKVTGRIPDNNEPFKTVPLAIYVGGTRRIIGTATVIGEEVTCWIDEDSESANLSQMITAGIIDDVTLSFKIPPPVGPRGLDGLLKDDYPVLSHLLRDDLQAEGIDIRDGSSQP
jgi:hypothetical protein